MRIYIKDLGQYIDKEVLVFAFLKKIREMKDVLFLTIEDVSGEVQVFVDKKNFSDDKIKSISLESSIKLNGVVQKYKDGVEVVLKDIELVSLASKKLPIDFSGKSITSLETRLDSRFLDLRQKRTATIFKLRSVYEQYIRDFLLKNSFIEIHTPKIISYPSEGGAEVFSVDYFDSKCYLTQSPQFYKQMAIVGGFDKVFEIGNCFRADRSKSPYHATEFVALDIEMAWVENVFDLMSFEETLLRETFIRLSNEYGDLIKSVFSVELCGFENEFPRFSLKEAIDIAIEQGYKKPSCLALDLDSESQMLIHNYVKEKYGSDFYFVYKWPFESRSFYHMKDDEGFSDSFDLIYKGVELTTGSLREHRLDVLLSQLEEKKLSVLGLDFYLDFFKFGAPPHGGFAIGLDRLISLMFDLGTIRESIYLYRGVSRIKP